MDFRLEHINAMIRICTLMATKATPVMGSSDDERVWYYAGSVLFNGNNYTVRYYTGDCSFGEAALAFFQQGQEIMRVVPVLSDTTDKNKFFHEVYADKRMVKQFKETLKGVS